MHDFIKLTGQLLVDFGDPVLNVGLHILGYDLAGLDDLLEELADIILIALPLLIVEGFGAIQDLIQEGVLLGGGRSGAGFGLFRTHFDSSGLGASAAGSIPICLASDMAFSVLFKTSPSNCSSLSLPSILLMSS